MRVAIDTNLLVYAAGVNGASRASSAIALIERLSADQVVIPAQVLGELFRVLVRKDHRSAPAAQTTIMLWEEAFRVAPTSGEVMVRAIDLAADHQIDIWDAVILAAAAEAHCRILLSEDMQDGFTWSGITVVNPFAVAPHRLLASALRASIP